MIAAIAMGAMASERFALVAGASDGGPERTELRHTAADADRVASVLVDLGGVRRDDLRLLIDPSITQVRAALRELADALAASGPDAEAVLYFTGHADSTGLRFGADQLSYVELRAVVDRLPAEVRVVVIDACSSGAVLRDKGGTLGAPVAVDRAYDGVAYLTSSAADEASQESDALGGSFFTHALTTGLRGAADGSGDGQVTLAEAYRYAYDRTLTLTERTLGGVQHASFDLRMAGAGDLVLTELTATPGGLVVPRDLGDSVTVRRMGGPVVAELGADRAQDTVIAVPPGRYELVVGDGGARSAATVTVSGSVPVRVEAASLAPMPDDDARAKGAGKAPVKGVLVAVAVASVVGTAASWTEFASRSRFDRGDAEIGRFYLFGSLAVLSTTTLVVLGGDR